AAKGWSESYPICVGRSNATLSPLTPCDSRYRYRRLDSVASANPAYWRMVQGRPRYIDGCTPLVKGKAPGRPRSVSGLRSEMSAGVRENRSDGPLVMVVLGDSTPTPCGAR